MDNTPKDSPLANSMDNMRFFQNAEQQDIVDSKMATTLLQSTKDNMIDYAIFGELFTKNMEGISASIIDANEKSIEQNQKNSGALLSGFKLIIQQQEKLANNTLKNDETTITNVIKLASKNLNSKPNDEASNNILKELEILGNKNSEVIKLINKTINEGINKGFDSNSLKSLEDNQKEFVAEQLKNIKTSSKLAEAKTKTNAPSNDKQILDTLNTSIKSAGSTNKGTNAINSSILKSFKAQSITSGKLNGSVIKSFKEQNINSNKLSGSVIKSFKEQNINSNKLSSSILKGFKDQNSNSAKLNSASDSEQKTSKNFMSSLVSTFESTQNKVINSIKVLAGATLDIGESKKDKKREQENSNRTLLGLSSISRAIKGITNTSTNSGSIESGTPDSQPDNNNAFGGVLKKAGGWLQKLTKLGIIGALIGGALLGDVGGIGTALSKVAGPIMGALKWVGTKLWEGTKFIATKLKDVAIKAWPHIKAFALETGQRLLDGLRELGPWLAETTPKVISAAFRGLWEITKVVAPIMGAIAWETTKMVGSAVKELVLVGIPTLFGNIFNGEHVMFEGVTKGLLRHSDTARKMVGNLFTGFFGGLFRTSLDIIKWPFKKAAQLFLGPFYPLVRQLGSTLMSPFKMIGASIVESVKSAGPIIREAAEEAGTKILTWGKTVGTKLGTAINTVGTKIGSRLAQPVKNFADTIITPLKAVFGKGTAAKVVSKGAAKGGSKVALKKIPVLGAIISIPFAINDWNQGRKADAIAGLASGVVSMIPIFGTAASVAMDLLYMSTKMKDGDPNKAKVTTGLKVGLKAGSKLGIFGLKKIPLLGSIIAIPLSIAKFSKGDIVGGLLEVGSGLGSLDPTGTIGNIVNIALDTITFFRDTHNAKMQANLEAGLPAGPGFGETIWNAITGWFGDVGKAVSDAAGGAINWVKGLWGGGDKNKKLADAVEVTTKKQGISTVALGNAVNKSAAMTAKSLSISAQATSNINSSVVIGADMVLSEAELTSRAVQNMGIKAANAIEGSTPNVNAINKIASRQNKNISRYKQGMNNYVGVVNQGLHIPIDGMHYVGLNIADSINSYNFSEFGDEFGRLASYMRKPMNIITTSISETAVSVGSMRNKIATDPALGQLAKEHGLKNLDMTGASQKIKILGSGLKTVGSKKSSLAQPNLKFPSWTNNSSDSTNFFNDTSTSTSSIGGANDEELNSTSQSPIGGDNKDSSLNTDNYTESSDPSEQPVTKKEKTSTITNNMNKMYSGMAKKKAKEKARILDEKQYKTTSEIWGDNYVDLTDGGTIFKNNFVKANAGISRKGMGWGSYGMMDDIYKKTHNNRRLSAMAGDYSANHKNATANQLYKDNIFGNDNMSFFKNMINVGSNNLQDQYGNSTQSMHNMLTQWYDPQMSSLKNINNVSDLYAYANMVDNDFMWSDGKEVTTEHIKSRLINVGKDYDSYESLNSTTTLPFVDTMKYLFNNKGSTLTTTGDKDTINLASANQDTIDRYADLRTKLKGSEFRKDLAIGNSAAAKATFVKKEQVLQNTFSGTDKTEAASIIAENQKKKNAANTRIAALNTPSSKMYTSLMKSYYDSSGLVKGDPIKMSRSKNRDAFDYYKRFAARFKKSYNPKNKKIGNKWRREEGDLVNTHYGNNNRYFKVKNKGFIHDGAIGWYQQPNFWDHPELKQLGKGDLLKMPSIDNIDGFDGTKLTGVAKYEKYYALEKAWPEYIKNEIAIANESVNGKGVVKANAINKNSYEVNNRELIYNEWANINNGDNLQDDKTDDKYKPGKAGRVTKFYSGMGSAMMKALGVDTSFVDGLEDRLYNRTSETPDAPKDRYDLSNGGVAIKNKAGKFDYTYDKSQIPSSLRGQVQYNPITKKYSMLQMGKQLGVDLNKKQVSDIDALNKKTNFFNGKLSTGIKDAQGGGGQGIQKGLLHNFTGMSRDYLISRVLAGDTNAINSDVQINSAVRSESDNVNLWKKRAKAAKIKPSGYITGDKSDEWDWNNPKHKAKMKRLKIKGVANPGRTSSHTRGQAIDMQSNVANAMAGTILPGDTKSIMSKWNLSRPLLGSTPFGSPDTYRQSSSLNEPWHIQSQGTYGTGRTMDSSPKSTAKSWSPAKSISYSGAGTTAKDTGGANDDDLGISNTVSGKNEIDPIVPLSQKEIKSDNALNSVTQAKPLDTAIKANVINAKANQDMNISTKGTQDVQVVNKIELSTSSLQALAKMINKSNNSNQIITKSAATKHASPNQINIFS